MNPPTPKEQRARTFLVLILKHLGLVVLALYLFWSVPGQFAAWYLVFALAGGAAMIIALLIMHLDIQLLEQEIAERDDTPPTMSFDRGYTAPRYHGFTSNRRISIQTLPLAKLAEVEATEALERRRMHLVVGNSSRLVH